MAQSPGHWSVFVRDVRSGDVLFDHHGARILRTASVGKLILLGYAGSVILDDPAAGEVVLDRRSVAPVADSGIWQHLDVDRLSVADAVRLVFLASDNLATNALIEHFGLDRIQAFCPRLGLRHAELLDIVRDERRAQDPGTLSVAPGVELCGLMLRLARGELVNPDLSRWMRAGLALNMDLSMVLCPMGLDPLAHQGAEAANKTGSDAGVRADTGIVRIGTRELAYAAVCNFGMNADHRGVLTTMRMIGKALVSSQGRPAAR